MVTSSRTPELALPVESLAAMRDSLVSSVGPEAAALALRQAGHAAGDALYRILSGGDPDALPALSADRFWAQLSRLFSSRGWGQLTYSQVHSGVGSLDASNWAEARNDANAGQPSCHFTTGILANLLGQIANAEVAVLEAECRSRGDHRCRFLFGGADAVYAVYERIAAGDEPDAALARLG
ncbi:MAG: 4-vinyl reductase [Gemmatimonadetes bacterium]|nr:4-vinyl reductase [Gemmatimonadota bacterium]